MKTQQIRFESVPEVRLTGIKLGDTEAYDESKYAPPKLLNTTPRKSMILSIRDAYVVDNTLANWRTSIETDRDTGFVWHADTKTLVHHHLENDEKPVTRELANFFLTFDEEIITVSREGKELSYSYTLSNGHRQYRGIVAEKNLRDFPKAYIKNEPVFYWLCGNDNLAKKYLAEQFQKFERNFRTKTIYDISGWYRLNGQFIYMNSKIPGCSSEVTLTPDIIAARRFLECYYRAFVSHNKASLLLVYSVYGFLSRLFHHVKLPGCNAILQVVGASGVGKTAISSVLANGIHTNGKNVPILRYDATQAYLEERIKKYSDMMWLVDDLFVSADSNEAKRLNNNANAIARLMGDLTHRGKCEVNRTAKELDPFYGSIVSTAEMLDLPSYSSYARSIIMNIEEGDIVFADALNELQKNPALANAWFSIVIEFVQTNQHAWLASIATSFAEHAKLVRSQQTAHKRFLAAAATLLVVAETVITVGKSIGYAFPVNLVEALLSQFSEYSRKLIEAKPETIIAIALLYSIETKFLKICNSENEYKFTDCDGYLGIDGTIVLSSNRVDDAMNYYSHKKCTAVPWKTPGIKEQLIALGVIVAHKGKAIYKYTKNRTPGLFRNMVICFDLKRLEELITEI